MKVVTVDRAHIAETHFFPEHAAVQHVLHGFFEVAECVLDWFANDGHFVKQPGNVSLQAVVERRESSLCRDIQPSRQRADRCPCGCRSE